MHTPVPPDCHIHTALCGHAVGMPLAYAAAAAERGIPEICITDHIPAPDGYDAESRMTRDQFPAYCAAVAEAERAFPGRVRLGIEADFYPGCDRGLVPLLEAADFDLVLGSIHFIGDWGFDNPATRDRWSQTDIRAVWTRYLELMRGLIALNRFDAISHFDLPKKFGHRLPDAELRELAAPVLDRIADAGLAMELNTGGLRKPVAEPYPSRLILSLMRERNIPILFGSDAHRPDEVGYAFADAVRLARDAGYTESVRFRNRRAEAAPLPG